MNITIYCFLMLVALVASCAASPNPCDLINHIELDEPRRSAAFKVEFPEEPLCDLRLEEGWYRFTSHAGGTMPTTCQETYQCGTIVPIWMNGTLPQESDGEVIRTVCQNFNLGNSNCCDSSSEIKVRNCNGFFVYYLYPTPACPLSYCAGDLAPCPAGTWSPTSFPPCEGVYPIMDTPPTLLGPVIGLPNNQSFSFVCQVNFSDSDPNLRFEVSWLFDGQEDSEIPAELLADPAREAILDGRKLAGHINTNIECRVRSYFADNEGHKSGYLRSNSYYAGVQASPGKLVYAAHNTTESFNLISTLPIVCDSHFHCCLQFYVDENGKNDIAVSTACMFELCPQDWDYESSSASLEINVAAKTMMAQVNKQLLLLFDELLPTGGPYQNAFFGARPNEVQIALEDRETYSCSATGDPHITSFDGGCPTWDSITLVQHISLEKRESLKPLQAIPPTRYYHLYLVGDFTAAQVPDRFFEIQIRTWRCYPQGGYIVTCICGIVIREENDIIRIDQCDQPYGGRHTSPVISAPYPLLEGTVVERSANGAQIGVYLRSGTEVKVDALSTVLNMIITLPSTDKDMAKGICGTNDGDRENDFEHPNGEKDRYRYNSHPNTFFESWRADGINRLNLFKSVPDPVNVTEDNDYCTCKDENIVCDASQKTVRSGSACTSRCSPQNINNAIAEWKNTREVAYGDFDEPNVSYLIRDISSEDLNHTKTWPTREEDGITEAQARDMCLKAIQKSQLSSRIDESTELFNTTMESCLADILYTQDTDFLDVTTTAITAASQVELAKDPASYVTDATEKPVLKPEFTEDICDVSCEEHGHCGEAGGCVCDPGWEGGSCHIESGKGPLLDRIRSGPLCDIVERPCKNVYIDVSNINLSDKLMCKVLPVDEDGNSKGLPVHTEATSLSAYRISCALPETIVSHKHYKISASNDGTLFGNELSLLVFNSLCMDCNETVCNAMTSACHIDRKCYRDGHINEDDSTKMCDISKATNVWSDVPTTTLVPTTTTTPTVPTTTKVPTTTPVPITTTSTTTTVPTTTKVPTTTPVPTTTTTSTTTTVPTTTTVLTTMPVPTTTTTSTTTTVPTTTTVLTTTPVPTTTTVPATTTVPTTTPVPTTTTTTSSTTTTVPTTTTVQTTKPVPTTTTTTSSTTTTVPTTTTVLTTTPVPTTTTVPATTTVLTTTPVPTTTTTSSTTTTVPTTTTVQTTKPVPTTTTVPTMTTAPATSTTTNAPTTTGVSNHCLKNSLFEGLIPHPADCNKFIACVYGFMYTMDCPSGLWFDINTKACQWPHDTNCPASNG